MIAERWRQLTLLSLAELLALSLWFSANAVLPALVHEWALSDAGGAGLTISVQLGFITGTLVAALTNLPDVWPARRLMAASALLGAAANAALALGVDHLGPALVLRFVTGLAMAGAYPPAMKIMATWFREGRGLALGILVGALTVGSATPHLVRGLTTLPWRGTLLVASAMAVVGAILVQACVREGPHAFPAARFDLRVAAGDDDEGGGALGCWAGGVVSDRWGRTRLTMLAMTASGLCALTIGFTFGGPPLLTLLVALVWGVTVIADSAQFSTAMTELAPPAYVGTALTAQTCAGFALTTLSIWLIPPVAGALGWRWAFATLAVGPFLGVAAMARLRALPEARRLAGGRR